MSPRRSRGSTPRIRPFIWYVSWALMLGAGIAVKALQPVQYIFGAGEDDELMVKMAQGFLHGHWSTTWAATGFALLAKPAGYPLFLAGAHFLPWSPVMSAYLLYLVGALCCAWGWSRLSGSAGQATALMAALVANPLLYAGGMERIYRDGFIEAAACFVVGLAFLAAGGLQAAGRRRWRSPGRVLFLLVSLLVGLGVGMVAISKPTWYWIVPAVLAPLVYPVVRHLRRSPRPFLAAGGVAVCVVVAVASCGFVLEGTKAMNKRAYGVSLVEDFSAGGLARTWKAWADVEAGPSRHFVPITRQMRLAVYKVSPAAAALEPYIHSRTDPFTFVNCRTKGPTCHGPGKFLEWALQWAVVETGKVHSELQFQDYLDTVADQIHAACDGGRLRCSSSPVLATGLPRLDAVPLGEATVATLSGLSSLVRGDFPLRPPPVTAPTPPLYQLWTSVVPAIPPPAETTHDLAPSWLYRALAVDQDVFFGGNLLALAVVLLGLLALVIGLRGGRHRARSWPLPATTALLFLLSGLVGMGTLGVFNVSQSPTYVNGLYASDFSAPFELCIVLAALAAFAFLAGSRRARSATAPSGAGRPEPLADGEPPGEGRVLSGERQGEGSRPIAPSGV